MRVTLTEKLIGVVMACLVLLACIIGITAPPGRVPHDEACRQFCRSVSLRHRGIDSLQSGQRVACVCGEDAD